MSTPRRRSIVLRVFADNAQAHQAMADLQRAGFGREQIRYSVHRGGAGLTDSLEQLGIPEPEAAFYNREFEAGRTVVMVNTVDRQPEADALLRRSGGYDFQGQAARMGSSGPTASPQTPEGEHVLRLHAEQLQARTQPVETGEVRLRKEVVTEPTSIEVPLTHDEVSIERRLGSRQPTKQPIGEGETYRISVREGW